MRVLMLGWELPPHNSGGLGVACYQLCKVLADKGADIEFIVPYTAEHPDVKFMRVRAAHPRGAQELLQKGGVYDSFKYTTNGRAGTDVFTQSTIYERNVNKIVKQGTYDVIHAHDWLTCRAAIRAKMSSGLPLIVHFHSIESDRAGLPFGGNPLVRDIEQMALLLADRVIAVSEYTKRSIAREYGIPASKIDVVHNHTDPLALPPQEGDNAYRYLEQMRKLGYRVIVNVGRLTIQKGVPQLLRAFRIVKEHAPKTLLLIVGDGEQRNELVEQAAEMGLADSVLFAGFQRGKRWRDAYGVADLFVMPSVSEPFGLTALEAVGFGVPVLISKQSGVSEVLRNALKVDFWDIDDMANKMVALVQNDALRDVLYSNSYRELLGHSWGESADKVLAIYDRHSRGAEVLAL